MSVAPVSIPGPHARKSISQATAEFSGMTQSSKAVVIGIGNAYRHDDAAGLMVARRLKEQNLDSCVVYEQSGEGTALMDLWKGAEHVVVIDAVQSGAAPGTIHRFDADLNPLPASVFRDSTHSFGLMEAVELSRALKQLPSDVVIYGIEGQNFEAGTGLSPAVQAAVKDLAESLQQQMKSR